MISIFFFTRLYYSICFCQSWHLTSKINRVPPLVMVNISVKFDEDAHKGLVSIVFTRSRCVTRGYIDWRTHETTAALLYPLRNTLHRDIILILCMMIFTIDVSTVVLLIFLNHQILKKTMHTVHGQGYYACLPAIIQAQV